MDVQLFSLDTVLDGGTPVHLRAIRPEDKAQLRDGFQRLSVDSIFFRFLHSKLHLSEVELEYLTEIDFQQHVAIVALVEVNGVDRLVGIARYIRDRDRKEAFVADLALTVDDEHQGMGIGTLLFKHLIEIARSKNVSKIQADVHPGNQKMLKIFQRSGFELEMTTHEEVIHIEFPLG